MFTLCSIWFPYGFNFIVEYNDFLQKYPKINLTKFFQYICIRNKRGTCIKGLIWSPLEPKLKIAFHQFLLLGLLEE